MKTNKLLKISAIVFTIEFIVLVICVFSESFAELYCRTLSWLVRFCMSFVFGLVSFSVSELIVVLLIPAVLGVIAAYVVLAVKKSKYKRALLNVFVSVILISGSVFINNFAVCYFRKPIEKNMGFEKKSLSTAELEASADKVLSLLNESCYGIEFSDSGASVNPYTWAKTSKLIDRGYNTLFKEYDFLLPIYAIPKKIVLSPAMTYTHISGIYFPFTSEANVNTNYPDYVVVFAMAHEKAHQRGIAGEDEANFIAALSLMASDDEYLRYAALANMYNYYLDAMFKNEKGMFEKFVGKTPKPVLDEYIAYSLFFKKYRDSNAAKVAESVNDVYIKSMGDSDGIKSYGKVVELFSGYVENRSGLPY